MISYNYEIDFSIDNEASLTQWIANTLESENFILGDINYVFCDDEFLLKLNIEYLNHDTLTDIISFDYSIGKIVHGEIFISVERVKDNAIDYGVSFEEELNRVIIHGILHYCGYKDKTATESELMRSTENHYLSQLF
ncbi:MAG: rRNA maturation RNase YbeY [Flaviramulus sp.]|nr:rRNA maturation RNase YbeY [Flaviramulus sp.]